MLNIPDHALNPQTIVAQSASGTLPGNSTSSSNSPYDKAAEKVENKSFDVVLSAFDPASKLKLVKFFKDRMTMTLVQAKNYVESLPQTVMSQSQGADADQMVTTLTEMGATCSKTESKEQ